jgi:hypothetical protein
MTKRNQKRTDDQIESETLATRHDPSAWEVLPRVPPSRSPRPEWATRATSVAREEATRRRLNGESVHTVPRDGGWANVRSGSGRASSVHRTQAEAIERGREIAQNSGVEHVIHGTNGRIRASNSYGNDRDAAKRHGHRSSMTAQLPESPRTDRKSERLSDAERAKKK